MKNSAKIMAVIMAALMLLAVYAYQATKTQINQTTTLDTFGRISVAIGKMSPNMIEGSYKPVEWTHDMFPSEKIKNGEILDAWGHAIHIIKTKTQSGYHFAYFSAGPDGIFDTADDMVQDWDYRKGK